MAQRKKGAARMGRPPAPPESIRRNRVVAMLTDAELRTLTRMAAERAVPIGTALYRLVKPKLDRSK